MDKVDTAAYTAFKSLKTKYSHAMILITDDDVHKYNHLFKSHRDFVASQFKSKGIEITRWSHNYASLETSHPELGLVYMVNDSVILPGVEVHALIGHNAKVTLNAG